jgi:hypothetical protein
MLKQVSCFLRRLSAMDSNKLRDLQRQIISKKYIDDVSPLASLFGFYFFLQSISSSDSSILWAGRLLTISGAKFPASRQAI